MECNMFAGASPDQVDKIFEQFDKDGNGFIDSKELKNVIQALAKDLGLDLDECQAAAQAIIEKSDEMHPNAADSRLSKEEFKQLLCL